MSRSVHRGLWTRDDRAAEPYRALPVNVPAGTEALTVTLWYERSAGVLDLGCAGPAGFRGWSGGARSTYGTGRAAATPGYLPGPLEPGSWQLLLGLHRVGPAGIRWEVTAETGRAPLDPPGWTPEPSGRPRSSTRDRPRRDLPAADGLHWLAGDLHTHSVHSDGALTLDELGALAHERGLDFLAVTDHNTVSHHAGLSAAAARTGVVLVPGQEVRMATRLSRRDPYRRRRPPRSHPAVLGGRAPQLASESAAASPIACGQLAVRAAAVADTPKE